MLGQSGLIVLYVIGAYAAALGQWLVDPASVIPMVGASGAVSAVIGAFFVGVTLELTRDLAQYRLVVYALLLILLMLFRPQGLFGRGELSLRGLRGTREKAVR